MAKETDQITDTFARLSRAASEQDLISRKLTKTMEILSDSALKKFTSDLKDAAKQTNLLNDEQLKLIKNSSDLAEAIEYQEKLVSDYNKLQKEYKKRQEEINAQQDKTVRLKAAELKQAEILYKEERDKINLTDEQIAQLEHSTESFRTLSDGIEAVAIKMNFWKKHIDSALSVGKTWIAQNVSAETSFKLLKGALTQSIDELNKATAVGLQDSFMRIGIEAVKLKLSFDEFLDIISKNRDIIRQLGYGTKGVEAFSARLQEASKPLAFMGRDGTIATSKFIESLKSSGIAMKDTEQFGKTMTKTQHTFIRWRRVYGDTADSFEDVIDSQMKGLTVQNQMIGMNKTQRDQLRDEIVLRTENLKNLGLSNDQIKAFSDRLEETLNPHTVNVGQTIKQAALSKEYYKQLAATQPQNKELQDAVGAIDKTLDQLIAHPFEGASNFRGNLQKNMTPAQIQALGQASGSAYNGEQSTGTMLSMQKMEQGGGGLLSTLQDTLMRPAAVAQAAGLSVTPGEAKKQGDIAQQQADHQSLLVGTIADARDALQQYTAIMQSTAGKGLLGLADAAAAAALSLGKFGASLKGDKEGGGNGGGIVSTVLEGLGIAEITSMFGGLAAALAGLLPIIAALGVALAGAGLAYGANKLYHSGALDWIPGFHGGEGGHQQQNLANQTFNASTGEFEAAPTSAAATGLTANAKSTTINPNLAVPVPTTTPGTTSSTAGASNAKPLSVHNQILQESQKQTNILTTIAQNTTVSYKANLDKKYQKSRPDVVANNMQ